MSLFISWSGEKSKAVAEALHDWLPNVIQGIQPWMSESDIEKGAMWRSKIARQLDTATVGIICLTPDNLEKPWLLFEAGAISKRLDDAFVCTYLLNVEPSDVKDPLAQFQATRANRDDTRKLLQTINRSQGAVALPQDRIDKAFDKWWPDLERALTSVSSAGVSQDFRRPDREMLEEVLLTVRYLVQISQLQPQPLSGLVNAGENVPVVEAGEQLESIRAELKALRREMLIGIESDAIRKFEQLCKRLRDPSEQIPENIFASVTYGDGISPAQANILERIDLIKIGDGYVSLTQKGEDIWRALQSFRTEGEPK